MEQKNIFISYKTEDFDQALYIKDALEQNGFSCWMAPMSIQGGASYAEAIPAAIRQCRAFVLILSQKTQESKWVPRELDQAINSNKTILPFMLEDFPLRDDFSFYLTNVQHYNAFWDMEGALAQMIRDLRNILGIPAPKPEAAPAAPEAETPSPQQTAEPVLPAKKKTPDRKEKSGKTKKTAMIAGVLSLILILAILTPLILFPNAITIAGQDYESDIYSLRLEDVTLTEQDLSEMSKFEHLDAIYLIRCTILTDNINSISQHNLSNLEISDCQLTNTQLNSLDLSNMSHLYSLKINGNPALTDFSALLSCAGVLQDLDISDIPIADSQWLAAFTQLQSLKANRTGLQDLQVLSSMPYLDTLELSGNNIQSLVGLENTSILRWVDLSNNALTDVSILGQSKSSLIHLNVSNNQITDLSCLSGSTELTRVRADHNQLTSLDWVKENMGLRILTASHNRIDSVSGLGIGEKLSYLNLANNQLQSIAAEDFTFGAISYTCIDLCNNQITALSLPGDCSYSQLALLGNPLADFSSLTELKGRNLYFDFPEDIQLETLQAMQFSSLNMVNCPVNRRVEIEAGLDCEFLVTVEEAMASIEENAAKELS